MYDDRTEDNHIVRRRNRVLFAVLALLMGMFCYVLYDLQIVHGAEYLESSRYTIVQTETVEAARGELLDTLGRVLVTNRVTYQVTLDTSLMGTVQQRNETLLELLELCRVQGVEWTDTLPITAQAPFRYTIDEPFYTSSTDEDGLTTRSLTRLGKLAVAMKWVDDPTGEDPIALPDAGELLELMCDSFALEGGVSAENRGAAGVLYELYLRSRDITWSSYVFAEDVDIEFISVVKERRMSGVQFETVSVRQFNTSCAAHLLGRVTSIYREDWEEYKALGYSMDASVGRDGMEKAFEQYLRGTSGTRILETNTDGKTVSESWLTDPESGETLEPDPGGNVVTTLNIRLQEVVERSLAERVAELEGAEGAAAVVLNVNDGSVLSMASYPTYDLATYTYDEELEELAPLLNRAIQGQYPPGSTFKMVTATGALEEEIITPTTKIRDTGRYTYYAPSYTPACWIYNQNGGTHGLINVSEAITVSCNVFFYDVGRRLGIDKLNEYARMFGLGEKTGIELDGEKSGVVAGREYTENILHEVWYDGSTLAAAIGQENNQFTPLQLANYIATLVNGGNHYATHLLKEVKSADYSQVLYTYEPQLLHTIDIKAENLDAIKKGMLALTESGSLAKYFTDVDVKVGAKTGSAQVSSATNSNAVLVAFAPYDDPEIALCIVVEKGGSGSELGAIAADIISYYFDSEETLGSAQTENTLIR